MNNPKTIRLIQEWREKSNEGKALPHDDLLVVFFGINMVVFSAEEWFTIGANLEQASEFYNLVRDKAVEGKNGGGLIEQVPIMLRVLTDAPTFSLDCDTAPEYDSGVNPLIDIIVHNTYKMGLLAEFDFSREGEIETLRYDVKDGEPITEREKSLIDLGIDIALGIIFNWFSVGGVEKDAAAYQHAIVNDVAEEGKNGGGTREKIKEMYKILSAKKGEEVEKVEKKEDDSSESSSDSDDE